MQKIRGYDAATQIANAPDFIKGILNLRGGILNIARCVIGMLVDSVSDVIAPNSEQIKPVPEMGTILNTDY